MKLYSSYKNSGVEWIGEIPTHWNNSKIKYETVVPVQYGINTSSESYVDEGIRFIRTTDITEDGKLLDEGVYLKPYSVEEIYKTKRNDLLISRSGTLGRAYHHRVEDELTYGGYLVRFNFGNDTKSRFVFYFTKSKNFEDWLSLNTIQSTIGNVNGQKYSNLSLPFSPNSEQQQIVSFLDDKTQKIDELIEKSEKKIELLKEKRTSLINHCVTKGLNPNVETKDSGVEWIGEIPKDWGFVKVGHYTNVVRGGSPRPSGDSRFFNGDFIHWITVKDISNPNGKYVQTTETYLTKEGKKQSRVLEPETLVLTNSGATLGIPKILKIKGCINDGSVGFLNVSEKVYRDYLYYFFTTQTSLLLEQQSGYGQPNLNIEIVSNIKFPLPPVLEQSQIVDYLDTKTKETDTIIDKETRRIELLKEYRQSLISEVVTGKIDVREENPA